MDNTGNPNVIEDLAVNDSQTPRIIVDSTYPVANAGQTVTLNPEDTHVIAYIPATGQKTTITLPWLARAKGRLYYIEAHAVNGAAGTIDVVRKTGDGKVNIDSSAVAISYAILEAIGRWTWRCTAAS